MSKMNTTCRNYPNVTQILEAELYDRRRKMNISQFVLAQKTELTRNCIQQIESYEHLPKLSTLFELMRVLEFNKLERMAFMDELYDMYHKDREFQKIREEQLGVVL